MLVRRGETIAARKPWNLGLNGLHVGGFLGAIGPYASPWNLVWFVVFATSLAVQLLLWRHIVPDWTCMVAGMMLAMWIVRVTGHRDPNSLDVSRAIAMVAGEAILALISFAVTESGKPLTPTGGDS